MLNLVCLGRNFLCNGLLYTIIRLSSLLFPITIFLLFPITFYTPLYNFLKEMPYETL